MTAAAGSRPTDPELYRRWAEEAYQLGRPDLAAELLRKAALGTPRVPAVAPDRVLPRVLQHEQAGEWNAAERILQDLITLEPNRAEWYARLGVALAQQHRLSEAIAIWRVSLRLDPSSGPVWMNVARACLELQHYSAAEAAVQEVITRIPQELPPRLLLVQALRGQNRLDDAEQRDHENCRLFPQHEAAWTSLGLTQTQRGKTEQALTAYQKAVELAPTLGEARANLAAALGQLRRFQDAEPHARAATELTPDNPIAWSNLGNCLRDLGRFREAEQALRQAVQLDPRNTDALGNLALTLANDSRFTEAIPLYDHVLEQNPQHHEARFNRGVAHLTLGNYELGWQDYESRWKTRLMRTSRSEYPGQRWAGESLARKTIFLHPEQGLGDTLQFVRWARPLAEQGATVLLHSPPELQRILASAPGIQQVLVGDRLELAYHYYSSLMSLPLHLGVRLEHLAHEQPYLTAPVEAVAGWRERVKNLAGFKIGIVWQGNPGFVGDRWRSVKLNLFGPLASIPNVQLISLQRGEARAQIRGCGFPVHDWGEETQDFADTAGLMMNLDLIVSTCTSVVHLAGALGRPAYVALSANPDWRWLRDREDSPWYPSLRLFRQQQLGVWHPVFVRIAEEVSCLVRFMQSIE